MACPPKPPANKRAHFLYAHVRKTGGTSLSIALALTTRPTCGSAISSHVPALLPATCGRATATRGAPADVALCEALRACTKRWKNDSTAWLLYDEQNADVPRLNFTFKRNFTYRTREIAAYAHCTDPGVVTTFGHNMPEVLGRLFPTGQFLVLLRDVVLHRISWHRAAHPERETPFSEWVNGSGYRGTHSPNENFPLAVQLRLHSALTGHAARGKEAARGLLSNPNVAWVGVTEGWAESMCALEAALGIHRFADFARHARSRVPKNDSKGEFEGVTASALRTVLSVEAEESFLVTAALRHVVQRAAELDC